MLTNEQTSFIMAPSTRETVIEASDLESPMKRRKTFQQAGEDDIDTLTESQQQKNSRPTQSGLDYNIIVATKP